MQTAPTSGAAPLSPTQWAWRCRMLAQTCQINVRESAEAQTFSIDARGDLVVPKYQGGSEQVMRLLVGGSLHEAAHMRWTDFSVLDDCSDIEARFLGFVEDGRIERMAMNEWAGAASELTAMWDELYTMGRVSRFREGIEDPLQLLALWCLSAIRAQTLGLAQAKDDAAKAEEAFAAITSPDGPAFVLEMLAKHQQLGSTREGLEWIRRLLEPFVRPDQKEYPDLIEGGTQLNSQDTQGAQDAAAEQVATASAGPAEAEPSDEQGQGDGASAAQAKGEGSAQQASSAGGVSQDQGHDEEPQGEASAPRIDVIEFEFEETDGGELAKAVVGELNAASDQNESPDDAAQEPTAQAKTPQGGGQHQHLKAEVIRMATPGEHLLAEVRAASMGLRARLQHLLKTLTSTRRLNSSKGRLDPSRAWRVKTMNFNVWKPKTERIEVDTYVHCLIDLSGSMENGPDSIAVQAMTAVAVACEGINGVKVGIDRFPGHEGHVLTTLKAPEQTVRVAASDLASTRARGGTPLLQALPLAVARIRKQRSSRQVLLIGTDGLPPTSEIARCRAAIAAIRSAGIEVVTIGIGGSANAIDPESISVRSVKDLAGALFAALSKSFHQHLRKAA